MYMNMTAEQINYMFEANAILGRERGDNLRGTGSNERTVLCTVFEEIISWTAMARSTESLPPAAFPHTMISKRDSRDTKNDLRFLLFF